MKPLFCRILLSLALWAGGVALGAEPGPVVLDIGHQSTATGAKSPDRRVNEYDFWCRYAGEVKAEIEAADKDRKDFYNQNEMRFQPYADGFYVNMITDGLVMAQKTGIYADSGKKKD